MFPVVSIVRSVPVFSSSFPFFFTPSPSFLVFFLLFELDTHIFFDETCYDFPFLIVLTLLSFVITSMKYERRLLDIFRSCPFKFSFVLSSLFELLMR